MNERAEGDGPNRKCKHPRMKVRLERIRAGPWDAVAKCQRGAKPGHRPSASVQPSANHRGAKPEDHHRRQITGEKHPLETRACCAYQTGDEFIHQHQAPLCIDKGSIARKERGIDRMRDHRDVKGLIGDAIAVAGAICGGEDDE
jgi:hypothetical protein